MSSLPDTQSFEAPYPAKPGEGVARRLTSADPPSTSKFGPAVDNLFSMFERAAKMYPDNNCFGYRPDLGGGNLAGFSWTNYMTIYQQCLDLASGVAQLGLPAKSGFGMYSPNCMSFQVVCLGMMSQGFACVPVYDTLGENIVQYEVNHADLPILFVDSSRLASVSKVLKDCPTLKYVVQLTALGSVPADITAAFDAAGVNLIDMPSLTAKGKEIPAKPNPPGPDDIAFIMYTSGTTGDPKGVVIKQLAITIGASYCAGLELLPTDRYLSFLPLAHIFETMVEHAILSVGGSIGFYNGNIKKVSDDILTLKPTLFVGVPRVHQRFYEGAQAKLADMKGLLKSLLVHALETETKAVQQGKRTFWGKVLAKTLGKKITGGCVRILISGAAPLPVHVHEFLVAAIGCKVVQGYGMTENAANATLANLEDIRAGHVGPPMPTMDIKLVDVPEMNYTTAENNCGEVCTKGPCNFAGYHKNKEETDKVLEPDGWLHTGDIGRWNPDGTLSIIDRKKNIFKLSQGEYIAAEKIEMIVSKSKYVAQPFVYGNSFFPMLVAVVTPDFVELKKAAKEGGWFVEDNEALAAKPEAKKFIMDAMTAEAKEAKLKSFELPKAVHLEGKINELMQGFSIENDCLTPTFKLKRPPLLKKYQAEIDAMYVALGEDPSKYKKI